MGTKIWFIISTLVSLSDQIFLIALTWSAIALSGPSHGAFILSIIGITRLGGIYLGGISSDRFGPLILIKGGLTLRLLSFSLAIFLAYFFDESTLIIWIAGLLFASGDGLFLPASGSYLRRSIDDANFASSMGSIQIIFALSLGVGAMVSGFGYSLIGIRPLYILCICTAGIAFALTFFLPTIIDKGPPSENSSQPKNFFSTLRLHPHALYLLVIMGLVELLASGVLNIVLPSHLLEEGHSSITFGSAVATFSLGAALGGLTKSREKNIQKKHALQMCSTSLCLIVFSIVLLPYWTEIIGVCVSMGVLGFGAGYAGPTLTSTTLLELPSDYSGRLMACINIVTYGSSPLAYLLASLLMTQIGTTLIFLLSGILLLIVIPPLLWVSRRE